MKIHRIRSLSEFQEHSERSRDDLAKHERYLEGIVPHGVHNFTVSGFSYTAGKEVGFLVDYQHSSGDRINWRERLCCPVTHFNNRMRATFQLFDSEMECYSDGHVYITEQITPSYEYFKKRFPNTVGSEYLGSKIPYGQSDRKGIRNENLCSLSFPDSSFDALVSLDVFEHVPDYLQAFRECARVLKPGKRMMWSVPFIQSYHANQIRAKIQDGEIIHILPPEYHGDPLSENGVLCFQYFGWEMLEQIKHVGFRDAYALCFYSNEFGYLGGEQFIFVAVK